jgi:hypothetical protein
MSTNLADTCGLGRSFDPGLVKALKKTLRGLPLSPEGKRQALRVMCEDVTRQPKNRKGRGNARYKRK